MEYVSERIVEIAKERGFNQGTLTSYVNGVLQSPFNMDLDELKHVSTVCSYVELDDSAFVFNSKLATSAPTYQQLIEWIFETESNELRNKMAENYDYQWLEFWYNTISNELITLEYCNNSVDTPIEVCANEFVMEGFIGMLMNWFRKNGNLFGNSEIANVMKSNMTFQEARHAGILKCFELIKNKI